MLTLTAIPVSLTYQVNGDRLTALAVPVDVVAAVVFPQSLDPHAWVVVRLERSIVLPRFCKCKLS